MRVFVAQTPMEAHLIRGLLQADGIFAEVRGEYLFTTKKSIGVIPGLLPEVWVLKESQREKAMDLVARYSKGEVMCEPGATSWSCPKCAEQHEPQFTECWKCGTGRPKQNQTPAV